MGQLIDGVWHDTWYDTKSTGGKFQRSASAFRNCLTADGAPGPTGTGGFIAEKDRYHLYISLACPWAHRTLIMRKLKGLEPFISVSVDRKSTRLNSSHALEHSFLHDALPI